MGMTAAVVAASALTAYQVSESEKAKGEAKKQRKEAKAQQAKVEAEFKTDQRIANNNLLRDKVRASQEASQRQAAGRNSTILTDGSGIGIGQSVGSATSTGGGKTLLGV